LLLKSSDKEGATGNYMSLRAPGGCAAISSELIDRHASLAMTIFYRWIWVLIVFMKISTRLTIIVPEPFDPVRVLWTDY